MEPGDERGWSRRHAGSRALALTLVLAGLACARPSTPPSEPPSAAPTDVTNPTSTGGERGHEEPPSPVVDEPRAEPERLPIIDRIPLRHTVYFASGSDVIEPRFFQTLAELAALLGDFPRAGLRVAGHTDGVEDDPPRGRSLARARAQAVRDALVARGVEATRLVVVEYGASRPLVVDHEGAGLEANRRVDYEIIDLDES